VNCWIEQHDEKDIPPPSDRSFIESWIVFRCAFKKSLVLTNKNRDKFAGRNTKEKQLSPQALLAIDAGQGCKTPSKFASTVWQMLITVNADRHHSRDASNVILLVVD
jgi:hypothetical protein